MYTDERLTNDNDERILPATSLTALTGTSVDYWPVTAKQGEVSHPACSNANPNHNTSPNLTLILIVTLLLTLTNPNPNTNLKIVTMHFPCRPVNYTLAL